MGVYFYADGGVLEGLWDTGEFVSSKKREDNGGNTKRDWSGEYLNVSSGTGFYISKYGHIITNHHVTQGCNKVKVHIGGKVFEAVKIADDEVNDLALIKIDQSPNQFFALSTTSPYPTQEILVAGFPFGEYISSTLKFTLGIISSLAGIKNNYGQIQIEVIQ